MQESKRIDQDQFIRRRLFSGSESSIDRYSRLVIGETGRWKLLTYELLTSLFGPIPGAAGIALRRVFFPLLFKKVGKRVVFGRSLTIRSAGNITLGDDVVIDDYCVVDPRGAGDAGLTIGDEVIVNRASIVLAKAGPLHIGSNSDIGAQTVIISQGGTLIGNMVTIGGGCKIGGGGVDLDPTLLTDVEVSDPNDFRVRGQTRHSEGPVSIGDRTVSGRAVMILDGASVGADCLLGSGVVIRGDIPDGMAVMPRPANVVVPRDLFGKPLSRTDSEPEGQPQDIPATGLERPSHELDATGIAFQILDEVNAQLPVDSRIAKVPDSHLMEPEGPLSSLGLINLVVAAEGILRNQLKRSVNLSSILEGASGENPFATVESLVEFIEQLTRGET